MPEEDSEDSEGGQNKVSSSLGILVLFYYSAPDTPFPLTSAALVVSRVSWD